MLKIPAVLLQENQQPHMASSLAIRINIQRFKTSADVRAGVGVGMSACVIAGLLMGFFLWRKKRSCKNDGTVVQTIETDASQTSPAMLSQD